MRYGSVCSGIEAATVAWHPLGWQPAWLSEIEKFPGAVLAHHYPDVPNLGDMTKFEGWPDDPIDVLVGGTPCQSFSVAGLRAGLADPRGNLMLTYLAIAARYRPRWVVWENVPGVLSSNGGRDFGAFLRGLGECGYGFGYRVLDAQFCRASGLPFAVPQRRRRVFVVGHLGDWRRAAAVLFDATSLRGDSAPRRETAKGATKGFAESVAGCLAADMGGGNQFATSGQFVASTGSVAHCLNAGGMQRQDYETETMVAHTLNAPKEITSNANKVKSLDRKSGLEEIASSAPIAIQERAVSENPDSGPQGKGWQEGAAFTLEARNKVQAVAFDWYASQSQSMPTNEGFSPPIKTTMQPAVATPWAVRRLTPTECERLQGFPDGYTNIPYRGKRAADGPRYKALGNSMAVNVMRVLGERIQMVNNIKT